MDIKKITDALCALMTEAGINEAKCSIRVHDVILDIRMELPPNCKTPVYWWAANNFGDGNKAINGVGISPSELG